MKLSPTQINYARGRINAAAAQRVDKAIKAVPLLTYKHPSFEEKYKIIASGRAKLKPLSKLQSYTDLTDAYEFPEFDKAQAKYSRDIEARNLKVAAISTKIDAEKSKLLDRLMLGADGTEILAAIERFAQGK